MAAKETIKKMVVIILAIVFLFMLVRIVVPGWMPKVKGENAVSEFGKAEINGTELQLMIRGEDRSNLEKRFRALFSFAAFDKSI